MLPSAFLLGCSQPNWLECPAEPGESEPAPLFVAVQRLYGRLRSGRLPRATGRWALDSGGFNHVRKHGRWTISAQTYAEQVWRLAHQVGNLMWSAPQDWMVEDVIRARTGLGILEHQQLTVSNFGELVGHWRRFEQLHAAGQIGPFGRACLPNPFRPVLQGMTADDYLRCADFYERSGIVLADFPVVGLGSVCRRQATLEIAGLIDRLDRELALPLHAFGSKIGGIALYGDRLYSSDSHAWSQAARLQETYCPHGLVRWERNCRQFALTWRSRVLDRIDAVNRADRQLRLF